VQRVVPRLVSSLDHAVALATNTLRYGRADETPPERKRLALVPVIAGAAEDALESASNIVFDNRVDAALMVDADPEQLYRIVLNLLRNAREALDERGTITAHANRKGSVLAIDISDNGPGIPEKSARAAVPAVRRRCATGRFRTGLAIARDLARAHGGDIDLVDSTAQGTRFRITIHDREG